MVGFTLNMAFAKLKRRRVERDGPRPEERVAPRPTPCVRARPRGAHTPVVAPGLGVPAALLGDAAARSARRWLGRAGAARVITNQQTDRGSLLPGWLGLAAPATCMRLTQHFSNGSRLLLRCPRRHHAPPRARNTPPPLLRFALFFCRAFDWLRIFRAERPAPHPPLINPAIHPATQTVQTVYSSARCLYTRGCCPHPPIPSHPIPSHPIRTVPFGVCAPPIG